MAPASQQDPDHFRVIISGGGIAGLALANALQLAGIDFLILERRNTIAPQVGASIGVFPNGARILDQIGIWDEILEHAEPLRYVATHRADGSIIEASDGPQLLARRTGYGSCFLERQTVLEVLSNHIEPSKILLEKDVASVEHSREKVVVKCKDGTEYSGDVLAGADGVNSKTRLEMWRLAKAEDLEAIPAHDTEAMTAEYKCLFGISSGTKDMPLGYASVTYDKDLSTLIITGKEDKDYWFIFSKYPKVYKGNEIPKHTKKDAEESAEEAAGINIQPNGSVRFRDIWEHRLYYTLLALEEAEYKKWTWGRIACLGDSIHKMTPNAGQGGNAAIESAAVVANSIKAMVDRGKGGRPTYEQVKSGLSDYQRIREKRTSEIMKMANKLTRIEALNSFGDFLFAHYIGPSLGDALHELFSGTVIGAVKIDYLPLPPRSVAGTMPFNPEQGVDKAESRLSRALVALPFLVLSAIAVQCMDTTPITEQLGSILKSGRITWTDGSAPVVQGFYGIKPLDELWRVVVVVFSQWSIGFDIAGSWQMFTFLTDFGLLYSIYLFEGARRANTLTLMQLPIVFGLAAQLRGIGVIAPIYYFLHYTFSPIEKLAASDHRLTDMAYTRTVLPAMVLAYYIPHFCAAALASSPEARMKWNWLWQMFPVWVSLAQRLAKRTGISKNTMKKDRLQNPWRDVPWLQATIGSLVILSAGIWIYTLRNAPVTVLQLFVPTWPLPTELVANLRNFVQFDHLFCFGSTFLWLGLLICDLKAGGMVQTSWVTITAAVVGLTAAAGPGAAVGAVWLFREHILATKRHKGVLLETTVINGTSKPIANGVVSGKE